MVMFGGSGGAIIKLRCPACARIQARARARAGTVYQCLECHKPFTREEGTPAPVPERAPRSRASTKKAR